MTVIPIRPLGVVESENRRAEGGRTGKLPLGVAATPSTVAPSSASQLLDEIHELRREFAHLCVVVEMQTELLIRMTEKAKEMGVQS